jgi:hypothetical protein
MSYIHTQFFHSPATTTPRIPHPHDPFLLTAVLPSLCICPFLSLYFRNLPCAMRQIRWTSCTISCFLYPALISHRARSASPAHVLMLTEWLISLPRSRPPAHLNLIFKYWPAPIFGITFPSPHPFLSDPRRVSGLYKLIQINSFIENSMEAGILLDGNGYRLVQIAACLERILSLA